MDPTYTIHELLQIARAARRLVDNAGDEGHITVCSDDFEALCRALGNGAEALLDDSACEQHS